MPEDHPQHRVADRLVVDIKGDHGGPSIHAPHALGGQPFHRRLLKGKKLLYHFHRIARRQAGEDYLPLGRGEATGWQSPSVLSDNDHVYPIRQRRV